MYILGIYPTLGALDVIIVVAPVIVFTNSRQPLPVISKIMGSGFLVLGSSMVTNSFRPITFFKYRT